MEFAIVLTGTIIPNSTFVKYADYKSRRKEYLKAIKFYSNFAPVFFLENSEYELLKDKEFLSIKNVYLRKFPKSNFFYKGKGFQEFEMIDLWVNSEKYLPDHWMKITGRYLICNFEEVFLFCKENKNKSLIIDSFIKKKFSNTYLFYIKTALYKEKFINSYKLCDDNIGNYIEKVIYNEICKLKKDEFIFFKMHCKIDAISGSSGEKYKNLWFNNIIKNILRRINFKINKNYIFIKIL